MTQMLLLASSLVSTLLAPPTHIEAVPFKPASSSEIQAFLQTHHAKQKLSGGKVTFSMSNLGSGRDFMWLTNVSDVQRDGAIFNSDLGPVASSAYVYYEPKDMKAGHLVIATVYANSASKLILSDAGSKQNSSVSLKAGESGHVMILEPANSRYIAAALKPSGSHWNYVFKEFSIQELH